MYALLPYLDDAVPRARDGPLDEQQVPLRIGRVHGQADLRHPLAAEAARHLHPLEDARGRRRSAARAWLADVVRAVRDWATAEVVPLDRAREALADRDRRDLDLVAGLERLDRHRFAERRVARPAELDQVAVGSGLAVLQVA